MTVEYQPDVIRKGVERLYSAARMVLIKYMLGLAALGAVGGWLAHEGFVAKKRGETIPVMALVGGAGIGAILGAAIGHEKSFDLRFRAQVALAAMLAVKGEPTQAQAHP